jgi:hypothetical protein
LHGAIVLQEWIDSMKLQLTLPIPTASDNLSGDNWMNVKREGAIGFQLARSRM